MSNLLDRIICDFQDLQQIRQSCQCKTCNAQNPLNKLYTGNCHHGIYCRKCIEQTNCFLCMSQESPNQNFITFAKKSRFRCTNYTNGCSDLIEYDALEAHERICKFKKECPTFPSSMEPNYYSPFTNQESPFKKLVFSGQPFFPKDSAKDMIPVLLNRIDVTRCKHSGEASRIS